MLNVTLIICCYLNPAPSNNISDSTKHHCRISSLLREADFSLVATEVESSSWTGLTIFVSVKFLAEGVMSVAVDDVLRSVKSDWDLDILTKAPATSLDVANGKNEVPLSP